MDALLEKIKDERNVKDNTLRMYRINLRKTFEAVDGDGKFNTKFLKEFDKVISFIEKYAVPTQRTYLSSYVVAADVLGDKELSDKYRKEMTRLRGVLEEKMKGGEKSDKQAKNWTGMEALRKVMRSMKKELDDDNVFKKEELTKRNMRELQDWVIANLFIGDDSNPPTRLDYAPMLIVTKTEYKDMTEEEKEEMNFLVKNGSQMFFSFNDYKTADKYGTKEIKVGKHLLKVLKFWLKHNNREYLLYNDKGDAMTSHQLGVKLKQIFKRTGKNVTANLIRSMYISEKFPREENDEKKEVASKMGHSIEMQQEVYSKKKD